MGSDDGLVVLVVVVVESGNLTEMRTGMQVVKIAP